ncbi:unnamed protein product [Clavelina lepadiformis]|uniref:Uncharacterized protein n=1 Tax=Clavelina lepadiformis TaxID=159417 RepID=A0ABP0EZ40_CLALP
MKSSTAMCEHNRKLQLRLQRRSSWRRIQFVLVGAPMLVVFVLSGLVAVLLVALVIIRIYKSKQVLKSTLTATGGNNNRAFVSDKNTILPAGNNAEPCETVEVSL